MHYLDCAGKKSAGISERPPLFNGIFFEIQEDTDAFVANYSSADRILDKALKHGVFPPFTSCFVKGCHAGDALHSKSQFAALDDTGVFGSICCHSSHNGFLV